MHFFALSAFYPEKVWDFSIVVCVMISRADFCIFELSFAILIAKMSENRKINLKIKTEALQILEKEKNISKTARILSAKYDLILAPSTIWRWKKEAAKIEKNATLSNTNIYRLIPSDQLEAEKVLYDELLVSFGKGVRLYAHLIKSKAKNLLKRPEFQSIHFNVSDRWLQGFNKVRF